jgi:hypothetical protein
MSDPIVIKLQDAADRPGPDLQPDPGNPIVVHVSAELVEGGRKRAVVAEEVPKGSVFEIFADEGRPIGGSESAPTPLSYFAAAIAF